MPPTPPEVASAHDRTRSNAARHPCRPGGVVLVGINAAPDSVRVGHYYHGRLGQRLWARLRLGLLSATVGGWEDAAFAAAVNGLADLVKRPTRAASELTQGELIAGAPVLAAKLKDWKPGLVFAFRPPVAAIVGTSVRPGRCTDFAGVTTFLLSGPYAAAGETARIDGEMRSLLNQRTKSAH